MSRAIVVATLRQRFTSPLRMGLVAALAGFPLLGTLFVPQAGLGIIGNSFGLALVFAAGLIGQDVSSGTLQLLLARPVTRTRYVVSRWAAAGLAASAVAAVQLALAATLLAARGHPPRVADVLALAGTDVILAFGVAAVITLFSALSAGLGDLALLLLAFFGSQMLDALGGMRQWAWASRAAAEVQRFLVPSVELAALGSPGFSPWPSVVAYASTVTLCLALAIVVVNRRELSYASG